MLVNIVPVWGSRQSDGKGPAPAPGGASLVESWSLKPPLRDQAGLKGKTLSSPGRVPGLIEGQCLSSSPLLPLTLLLTSAGLLSCFSVFSLPSPSLSTPPFFHLPTAK